MRTFSLFLILSFFFSDLFSQISPCVQNTGFHIVILGSSTASGAGASPSDSSWVNRYRSYLQSFHPDYQVTNRAQGGFTTYRIMPTGFIPPAGRPLADTSKNITYAIGLNPDAIIINLPSNDVSSGYSVAEQLANLDTVYTQAQQAGIPIWICTTQPKNYNGNQNNIQKQLDVRDSIFQKYGSFSIDFWTELADSTNQLSATYDSGDGTHLNNSGHNLLFTRVADTQIPDHLFVPKTSIDYTAAELSISNLVICGSENTQIDLDFYNRGAEDSSYVPLEFMTEHLPSGQISISRDTLWGGLSTCESSQVSFVANTTLAGAYTFVAILVSNQDNNQLNDTVRFTQSFLGFPQLTPIPDTGCTEAALELTVLSQVGDSVRWYDAQLGGNLLTGGPVFQTPLLSNTTAYYVEAARGDFFYRNSLSTANNANIDWNGAMFDIFADTALVIDSVGVKFADTGLQAIEVYTRMGSHLGFEEDPMVWNFLGSFPVQIDSSGLITTVNISEISLNVGDTLGMYIQLEDPDSRLSYQWMNQPAIRSNDQMTIITGSGSRHDFGGSFFPRDWNGTIYYHYGSKPDGDCLSDRIAIEAFIGSVSVELGEDTILNLTDTLLLSPGNQYATYQWSDGSIDSTLLLDGNQSGKGVYPIYLTVTDSLGCEAKDTIIVVFAPLVGIEEFGETAFRLWPNPIRNGEGLSIQLPMGDWEIEMIDLMGRKVFFEKKRVSESQEIRLPVVGIAQGTYHLIIRNDSGNVLAKMLEIKK